MVATVVVALQIALGSYAAAASPVLVARSALRNGFQWCGAFGDYTATEFNVFMAKELG